jgi:4-hydroxy-tetrahydrodipicolinate reductase
MIEQGPIRVLVFGASGRLGRSIIELLGSSRSADEPGELLFTRGLGRQDQLNEPEQLRALEDAEVVIDVSLPSGTSALLEALSALKSPPALVCGVTGLSVETRAALDRYASRAPCLYARNFSLGVALLSHLVSVSARVLGPAYDVELFELHHRQKIDAPSGTALHLAELIAEVKGGSVTGEATASPRDSAEVHLSAGRGGQVIGEHTVYFLGGAERLELTHRARDRGLFAEGALRAARWLAEPGRETRAQAYEMSDLIEELTRATLGASG